MSGNGTDTTPTGYSLPTTGTATCTYQWDASYNGDGNNASVSDNNAASEQVVVTAASPALSTTPSPNVLTLGTSSVTLKDSAVLSGGYFPTGSIDFTLYYDGGTTPVDTETVPVSGDGTYTTPTGCSLPTTRTVAGAYQWDASYDGDGNNAPVSDNNDASEQVAVTAASASLSTTPSASSVTLGRATAPTLTDSATLSGGNAPTGTVTFTLSRRRRYTHARRYRDGDGKQRERHVLDPEGLHAPDDRHGHRHLPVDRTTVMGAMPASARQEKQRPGRNCDGRRGQSGNIDDPEPDVGHPPAPGGRRSTTRPPCRAVTTRRGRLHLHALRPVKRPGRRRDSDCHRERYLLDPEGLHAPDDRPGRRPLPVVRHLLR